MTQISAPTHNGRVRKFPNDTAQAPAKRSLTSRPAKRERPWSTESSQAEASGMKDDALRQGRAAIARAARATVHEIRQPLVGVITNAGAALRWLDHSPPDLDEARSALERVIRDGRRAGDILERIHQLFAGTPGERARVDLNAVVREAVIDAQKSLRENGVAATCVLDPALPPVVGDRVQLGQCVLNLLVNAAEALASVRDRPRRVTIRSFVTDAAEVAIEVSDSGPGFEPALIKRMFDPAFSTKPSGMGVGLSICRMIVEAHGGRVSASPGQPGAVFRITLAAAGESAP